MKIYTIKIKDSPEFWDDAKRVAQFLRIPLDTADFLRNEKPEGIREIRVTRYHTTEIGEIFFDKPMTGSAEVAFLQGLITAEYLGHDLLHTSKLIANEAFVSSDYVRFPRMVAVLAIGFDFLLEEE